MSVFTYGIEDFPFFSDNFWIPRFIFLFEARWDLGKVIQDFLSLSIFYNEKECLYLIVTSKNFLDVHELHFVNLNSGFL